ncbi:MAG TPA: SDR family NAD(P)-dependent oxidoreductase [Polyangiaceae bacterium]|nr:SDR family NAD(P)-dependent oxidoreductase [Polyangiaceae bacterium]
MNGESLDGRSILITGASSGIGRATALALAARGATLYLAGRSEERHRDVLEAVRAMRVPVHFLPLDLSRLASVRECAERFLALDVPLHVLLNNAGMAGSRGLTADGFERAFGINHLGPFLLTELLLERLGRSAPSRIVNLSSKAHYRVRRIDWAALQQPTRNRSAFPEYAVSKLCNILHARELATRLQGRGINTYALHPGVVASDIWRRLPWLLQRGMMLFMRSNEDGARTSLHCATSDAAGRETGLYYDDSSPKRPSPLALDDALARELAEKSRQWAGLS